MTRMERRKKQGLDLARSQLTCAELARRIGVSRNAVHKWDKHIPADRVHDVAEATGIKKELLRPDLFED